MDTTQTTTHISLCAGYGGIDLGLKRAIPNLRTVAFSEIEAFACANLVSKMEAGLLDPAPVWTDLKTFPWQSFRGKVDILSGGYPCQPFSSAGKRLGKDDPRHLWPYIADGIRILQPALCFFENVEGHITLGLRDVLDDLGELGYRATWGIFSASEVGAPHQRKRVFILAHRSGAGLPRHWGLEHVGLSEGRQAEEGCAAEGGELGSAGVLWPSRPGQPQFGWEPPRVAAHAQRDGRTEARRDAEGMGAAQCGEEGGKSESGATASSADGSGSELGNTEGQRSSTRWTQYEGLSGQLCSPGTSGAMGNADSGRLEGAGSEGGRTTDAVRNRGEGSDENLGDAEDRNCEGQRLQLRQGQREHRGASGCERDGRRETQPSLVRNADGPAGRMDYAQLCVAGDNRIDELRLIGNGVVPATATRAFLTLIKEL